MSECLCLYLRDEPCDETALEWIVLNEDHAVAESGTDTIAGIASRGVVEHRKLIMVVPADQALLTSILVPDAQRRHINQVLPFFVEEQIIDPIESMHLARSLIASDGTVAVVGIRREFMHDWLDLLEEHGLAANYMFLDVLCLPDAHSNWQLLFEGDRALLRLGPYEGLASNQGTLQTMLKLAISERSETNEQESRLPFKAVLACASDADTGDDGNDTASSARDYRDQIATFIRSENIDSEAVDYRETTFELLSVNASKTLHNNLNLLQGVFRASSSNDRNQLYIKRAGIGIAASLAVFLLFSVAGGAYLNYQADRYFDDSVALYKELFPKQRRIFDPVTQMKRKLAGEAPGTTSEFLPLLDAASSTLAESDALNGATLTQLRYDMQRGNIIMDLQVSNIDVLESYKEELSQEGLKVDIMSANQNDKVVNGRLQVGRI